MHTGMQTHNSVLCLFSCTVFVCLCVHLYLCVLPESVFDCTACVTQSPVMVHAQVCLLMAPKWLSL